MAIPEYLSGYTFESFNSQYLWNNINFNNLWLVALLEQGLNFLSYQ